MKLTKILLSMAIAATVAMTGCSDNSKSSRAMSDNQEMNEESSSSNNEAGRGTTMGEYDANANTDNTGTNTGMGSPNEATAVTGANSELHTALDNSLDKMMEMDNSLTGDFESDFANMMIAHHRSGIKLSEELLESKTQVNANLKEMANNMISNNKKDIQDLQAYASNNKASNQPSNKVTEDYKKSLMEPMKELREATTEMQLSGNVEQDFVKIMQEHHESGQELAEVAIDKSKNQQLIAKAKEIKQNKEQTLEKLKDLDKDNLNNQNKK